MASEKIIDKILQNAEEEKKKIIADGQEKALAISQKIQEETDLKVSEITKKNKADIEAIKDRTALMTRLEIRKNTLAVKHSLIDEAFKQAAEALKNYSDIQKKALITKIVLSAVETGEEKLQVPKDDREMYETGFLDTLNNTLKQQGKKGELSLDDTDGNFEVGLKLVGEKADINGNFDILLEAVRDQYEREVAEIIYQSEV